MSDEEQSEVTEAPKKLSMKQLQADMDAQNEAVGERLDGLEEGITDMSAKFDTMMDLLKGMNAQNRPTGTPKRFESEEQVQDPGGAAQFKQDHGTGLEKPEIEIVGETRDLAEPAMMEKVERLAFDRDILTISFHEPPEEDGDQYCEFGLNGRTQMFIRDPSVTYEVPRALVEVIAQAKPNTFTNQEYTKADGVRAVRQNRRMGIRYPFNVLYDPAGRRGAAWLQEVLARRA